MPNQRKRSSKLSSAQLLSRYVQMRPKGSQPPIVFLRGEAGTGKTSLIRQVVEGKDVDDCLCIYLRPGTIDFSLFDTLPKLSRFHVEGVQSELEEIADGRHVFVFCDEWQNYEEVEYQFLLRWISFAISKHNGLAVSFVIGVRPTAVERMQELSEHIAQIDPSWFPLEIRMGLSADRALKQTIHKFKGRHRVGEVAVKNIVQMSAGNIGRAALITTLYTSDRIKHLDSQARLTHIEDINKTYQIAGLQREVILSLPPEERCLLSLLRQAKVPLRPSMLGEVFADKKELADRTERLQGLGLICVANDLITDNVEAGVPVVETTEAQPALSQLGQDSSVASIYELAGNILVLARDGKVTEERSTAWVKCLHDIAFSFRKYLMSERLCRTILEQLSSNPVGEINSLLEIIDLQIQLGQYRQAREFADLLFDKADNTDIKLTTTLQRRIVHASRLLGDFDRLSAIVKQIRSRTEPIDQVEALFFASQLATVLLLRGDFQGCAAEIEKWDIENTELKSQEIVQLSLLRGHLWREENKLDHAALIYERASKLSEELSYLTGLANAQQSLAFISQFKGDVDQAAERFEKAKGYFAEVGNEAGAAHCEYSLAQLKISNLELVEGLSMLEIATRRFRMNGNRRELCDAMLQHSLAQKIMGHQHEGLQGVRESASLAEIIGAEAIRVDSLWELFLYEMAEQNYVDASIQIEKSAQIRNRRSLQQRLYAFEIGKALVAFFEDSSKVNELAASTYLNDVRSKISLGRYIDILALLRKRQIVRVGDFDVDQAIAGLDQELTNKQRLQLFAKMPNNFEASRVLADQQVPKLIETACHRMEDVDRRVFLDHWQYTAAQTNVLVGSKQKWLTSMQKVNNETNTKLAAGLAVEFLRDTTVSKRVAAVLFKYDSASEMNPLSSSHIDQNKITIVARTCDQLPFGGKNDKRIKYFLENPKLARDIAYHSEWQESAAGKKGPGRRESYVPKSLLVVPMRVRGSFVGFLYLDHDKIDAFSDDDRWLAEMVGLHLGLSLVTSDIDAEPEESTLLDVTDDGAVQSSEEVAIVDIVRKSDVMQSLIGKMQQMRDSEATVFLEGSTGVGKGLIARSIHMMSPRQGHEFVTVDCGAIRDELFDAQLFGYEKGAFTGAHQAKIGLLKAADHGTIFLDNVHELSLRSQAKLLRVLQESEIRPVGAIASIPINLRVIAATDEKITTRVENGTFRSDLFYRLDVVHIDLPGLQERRADIPELIHHFLEQTGRKNITLDEEALQRLLNYEWPGNVRQLQNEIQRAAIHKEDDSIIRLADLSTKLREFNPHEQAAVADLQGQVESEGLVSVLDQIERRILEQVLMKHNGNISKTARELGIARLSLRRRMKKYGFGQDLN